MSEHDTDGHIVRYYRCTECNASQGVLIPVGLRLISTFDCVVCAATVLFQPPIEETTC